MLSFNCFSLSLCYLSFLLSLVLGFMLSINLSFSFCIMPFLLSVFYCLFRLPELLFYFAFIFTTLDP